MCIISTHPRVLQGQLSESVQAEVQQLLQGAEEAARSVLVKNSALLEGLGQALQGEKGLPSRE